VHAALRVSECDFAEIRQAGAGDWLTAEQKAWLAPRLDAETAAVPH
jgi:hypothetical protein